MQHEKLLAYNERWDYYVGPKKEEAIEFALKLFLQSMDEAQRKGKRFRIALSGGSTPKELYAHLAANASNMNWKEVEVFWSDERCVLPDDPDSNYKMAMDIAFGKFPIPKSQIYRMKGEIDPQKAGELYHALLEEKQEQGGLDFTFLGMGEDCHTASLFPETHALDDHLHLATANYIPKLDSWRLTLTFKMINLSKKIAILCLGEKKKNAVRSVFFDQVEIHKRPIQGIGTSRNKAIWILDKEASSEIPL